MAGGAGAEAPSGPAEATVVAGSVGEVAPPGDVAIGVTGILCGRRKPSSTSSLRQPESGATPRWTRS
eukprot:14090086-Alexandrium_andersonii.AAC.1